MQIEVLVFAAAREAVGSNKIQMEMAVGATAGDVLRTIGNRFPELAPLLPSCRLAIDNQYVSIDAELSGRSEIALIPPVSGG